jgi:hypothetical protein
VVGAVLPDGRAGATEAGATVVAAALEAVGEAATAAAAVFASPPEGGAAAAGATMGAAVGVAVSAVEGGRGAAGAAVTRASVSEPAAVSSLRCFARSLFCLLPRNESWPPKDTAADAFTSSIMSPSLCPKSLSRSCPLNFCFSRSPERNEPM